MSHPSVPRTQRAGVALIELVVVLIVLTAVAGMVVPYVAGIAAEAPEVTTRASFLALRDVIFGASGTTLPGGFLADNGRFPTNLRELFVPPEDPTRTFDPSTRLGWRGPYLGQTGYRYRLDHPDRPDQEGFTLEYGEEGDPTVSDGWGHAILLQIPDPDGDGNFTDDDLLHMRLVSAGENGKVETPRSPVDAVPVPPGDYWFPTIGQCNDDLVYYLRVHDAREPGVFP